MPKALDLTGKRFGRLVVLSYAGTKTKSKNAYWNCKCDCGNETVAAACHMKSGHTLSCGCLGTRSQSRRVSAEKKRIDDRLKSKAHYYRQHDRVLMLSAKNKQRNRKTLNHTYLKSLIRGRTRMRYSDIPQEFIDAKLQHMRVIRLLKEM